MRMLRRPTITDARGRTVPLIAHEMFARDRQRRSRLQQSGWTLGPKGPLIIVLLVLTLIVFALLPSVIVQRLNGPGWMQMGTAALPGLVSMVGFIFWTRRLAPDRIAQTYLRARYCPSCGYDLAHANTGADGAAECSECGAAWRPSGTPRTPRPSRTPGR